METSSASIPLPPNGKGGKKGQPRTRGSGRKKGVPNKVSRDIKEFLQSRMGAGSPFAKHIDYLCNSLQIFRPENAWLCKALLPYAWGLPNRQEEKQSDPMRYLIFLSKNPIGDDRFDPLAGAKPVGSSTTPLQLEPAGPQPEPETGTFVGLDGKEKSPEEEVQLFRDPGEVPRRRADQRPDYR